MCDCIDLKGWHIWQNTQGRIMCNGPDLENRLLDFKTLDDAVNWLFISGYKEQARALNACKGKAQPAGLWERQMRS